MQFANGWDVKGVANPAERQRCLERFGLEAPHSEDMERWFFHNPWLRTIVPKKWKLDSCTLSSDTGTFEPLGRNFCFWRGEPTKETKLRCAWKCGKDSGSPWGFGRARRLCRPHPDSAEPAPH